MSKNTCSKCRFWKTSDNPADRIPGDIIGSCTYQQRLLVACGNNNACRHFEPIGIENYPVDEKDQVEFLKKANEINAKPITKEEKLVLLAKLFVDSIIGICADYHTQKEAL